MKSLNVKTNDDDLFEANKKAAIKRRLSEKEEKRLMKLIKQGDKKAINKLVNSWTIIVIEVAKQILVRV